MWGGNEQQPYRQSYGQPPPGQAYGGQDRASQLSSSMQPSGARRPAPAFGEGPIKYTPADKDFRQDAEAAIKTIHNITKWSRWFLIAINALSIGIGIWLILFGWYAMHSGGSAIVIEIVGKTACIVAITCGVILLLLSLIGFCSARNTSRVGLFCYMFIIITAIPFLISVSSIAFTIRGYTDEVDGYAPLADPLLKTLVRTKPDVACSAYRALGCSGGMKSCAVLGYSPDFCPPGCPTPQDTFSELACYTVIMPTIMKATLYTALLTGAYSILLIVALCLACCTCFHNASDDGENGPAASVSSGLFGLLGMGGAAPGAPGPVGPGFPPQGPQAYPAAPFTYGGSGGYGQPPPQQPPMMRSGRM